MGQSKGRLSKNPHLFLKGNETANCSRGEGSIYPDRIEKKTVMYGNLRGCGSFTRFPAFLFKPGDGQGSKEQQGAQDDYCCP